MTFSNPLILPEGNAALCLTERVIKVLDHWEHLEETWLVSFQSNFPFKTNDWILKNLEQLSISTPAEREYKMNLWTNYSRFSEFYGLRFRELDGEQTFNNFSRRKWLYPCLLVSRKVLASAVDLGHTERMVPLIQDMAFLTAEYCKETFGEVFAVFYKNQTGGLVYVATLPEKERYRVEALPYDRINWNAIEANPQVLTYFLGPNARPGCRIQKANAAIVSTKRN